MFRTHVVAINVALNVALSVWVFSVDLLYRVWSLCTGCSCVSVVARFTGGWSPAVSGLVVGPALVSIAFVGLSGGTGPRLMRLAWSLGWALSWLFIF